MIRYLRFSPGHMDFFNPRDQIENLEECMLSNFQNPLMDIITVAWDNQILTIAGCTELRRGVCEVWLLLDKCYREYPKTLVKAVKTLMEEYLVKEKKYYRLQMAIDSRLEERNRWAEYLGFSLEGTMKAYDLDKIDYNLYARIF